MPSRQKTFFWIFLHTLAILCVITQVFTGLRFSVFRFDNLLSLSAILPQGALHDVHIMSGVGLTLTAIAYVLYRFRGAMTTRQLRTPASFNPSKWRIDLTGSSIKLFNLWVIRLGYLVTTCILISGWLLYFDASIDSIDFIHFILALCMVGYLFFHGGFTLIQFGYQAAVTIFKPGITAYRHIFSIVVSFLLCFVIGLYFISFQSIQTLFVRTVSPTTIINIDGKAEEHVWHDAQSIEVKTHGGANFENGQTTVSLKALQNGSEIFMLAQWQDSSESLNHLPLEKTEKGWAVRSQGFYQFDEKKYYEDKFAILLSTKCEMAAAGTAHLGPQPLKDQPPNWHGRGYHYAEDGETRDLWHWKAVRTNGMFLVDDNYIGRPEKALDGQRRYTAGYYPDSKESGAYIMNWQWYSPNGITPKRIPSIKNSEPSAASTDQTFSENGHPSSVLPWFDTQAYQASKDPYTVGDTIPSVLMRSNRFEGDRADVRGFGVWKNGQWTLEMVRKLNTGSQYDLPIEEGLCMWVSAFDHAQTHHTRHHRPIQLQWEK